MWSDAAKQLVREAARAGFPDTADSQIKIALEPEAAALTCRAQQLARQVSLSTPNASLSDLLKTGARFIVADLGAGTADFSELVVAPNGTIKETAPASGGPWGGYKVEKKLLDVLDVVFGADNMKRFKSAEPIAYHELERNIRNLKHRVDPTANTPYRLTVPFPFMEAMGLQEKHAAHKKKTGESELPINHLFSATAAAAVAVKTEPTDTKDAKSDVKDAKSVTGDAKVAAAGAAGNNDLNASLFSETNTMVYSNSGYLKLSHGFVMALFEGPKAAIVQHLDKILTSNPLATMLFMVGGFSECPVVQLAVDTLLLSKKANANGNGTGADKKMRADEVLASVSKNGGVPIRVLPTYPGLCVMNGAVHFGINPHLVSSRISKMAFGIWTGSPWNDEVMLGLREKEYRYMGGRREEYCSKMFSRFCEVGESIDVDHQQTLKFKPGADYLDQIDFTILATPKKGVIFADDPSVFKIGVVSLYCPLARRTLPSGQPDYGLNRDLVVSMKFGCTEVTVTAKEATSGGALEAFIDCLDFDLDASSAKITRR